MRLFLAIKIPDDILSELSYLPPLINGVKRVPDYNRHLTLLFLGEKYEQDYHQIINSLNQIKHKQFLIKICNTGIFKHRKKVSTLWAGVEKNNDLESLYKAIINILKNDLNFIPDKKNYTPHITLGKAKPNLKESDLVPFLSSGLYNLPLFKIESFSLFSSLLTPEGAIYTEEEKFYLGSTNE